jgi:hypothetical protein
VWTIRAGTKPRPFVAIWPRSGAKSTSAEMACVSFGARGIRRYGLYVCETQDQANDHVQNVGALLESPEVGALYPELAERKVGKFGPPKGWRRNRLWTRSGFVIDAIGLDTAKRGAKLEDDRPDFIVIDDVDDPQDSAKVTESKITTITKNLLPAGSEDAAVLAVQNLVHPNSIFARLAGVAEEKADFLADRIVSGPHPALRDIAYEDRGGRWVIVSGEPTWQGMDLAWCQAKLTEVGITAFLGEQQHEVSEPPGGMYDHLTFAHCEPKDVPDFVRTVVWVDPAVTNTDKSDSHGIQADGLAPDGKIYRLFSWEQRTSPEDSLRRAVRKAIELGAEAVGVETDQGGDVWRPVYNQIAKQEARKATAERGEHVKPPGFRSVKAGAGHGSKVHRSSLMLADYERNRITHVLGTHHALERALRRFPLSKPLDLADAAYWSWADLRGRAGPRRVPTGVGVRQSPMTGP